MKPKSILVAADDVTLSKPLYNPNIEVTPGSSRASMSTKPRGRFILSPLRHANYSSWRAFRSLRAWFTKERFIDVTVKNRTLPLSIAIDAAWADDHGRTLDKVVKHGR